MLKVFANFSLFSKQNLMDTIYKGDTISALALIGHLSSVNYRCSDSAMTPLQASLFKKNHQLIVALLEKGADPNAVFIFSKSMGSTFSAEILAKDLDTIKLLILHGAKVNDEDWQFVTPAIETIIASTSPVYQKLIEFENTLKINNVKITKIYRCLQELWHNLAQDEPNLIYKEYYQHKASQALARYIELDTKAFQVTIKSSFHKKTMTKL